MHGRRVATGVAFVISLGSLTALPAAHATTGTTLYVNNGAAANCSDATADSSVAPYCTIQAAVGAVTAGETIQIASGFYTPFSITKSGTARQPITIMGTSANVSGIGDPIITSHDANPAIAVTSASYVNLSSLKPEPNTGSAVAISGSDHLVLDGMRSSAFGPTSAAVIAVSSSSQVTISRADIVNRAHSAAIAVTGGTGDTITTNWLQSQYGPGLLLDGATATAATSNTVGPWCGFGIEATDSATGASIENNVITQLTGSTVWSCSSVSSADVSLLVDSSSAAATVADYNDVYAGSATDTAYSWAGEPYTSATALTTATSQGSHDSNTSVSSSGLSYPVSNPPSATTDSANFSAPGELDTDIVGYPRVDDPLVANSGAGSHDYYDRGAAEYQDPISFKFIAPATSAPIGGSITVSAAGIVDGWSGTDTCTIDFGDGTTPSVVTASNGTCADTHVYAAVGTFPQHVTVTSSYGSSRTVYGRVSIVAPAPLVLNVSAGGWRADSVIMDTTGTTDSWNITSVAYDFGDGGTGDNSNPLHQYTKPGTYTIKATATDSGGNTKTVQLPFTTSGSYYTPLSPVRILDTRKGIGVQSVAKVPANGTVNLKVAGVAGVPDSGATAVALNVTVTNPSQGGYITAYPGGETRPTASNLNFTPAKTVPNLVIVRVGPNGYVSLTNGGGGTLDLVADLAGYYSIGSSDGYVGQTPTRLLDTRKTASTIPAYGVTKLYVGNYAGAAAVVLNVTVTRPSSGGYITAYPDGETWPVVSNLNFSPGQTVPNEVIAKVGADGYVDFANGSAGSADLVVDLSGYFTSGSGAAFVPIDPRRYMDTRIGLGLNGFDDSAPYTWLFGGGADRLLIAGTTFNDGALEPVPPPASGMAVAANITVTQPTSAGYLTVYPDDQNVAPTSSVVNYAPGQTIANATTATLGAQVGGVYIQNTEPFQTHTDVIVDVFGYYSMN